MNNAHELRELLRKSGDQYLRSFIQTVRDCLASQDRAKTDLDPIFQEAIMLTHIKGMFEKDFNPILEAISESNTKENRGLDCLGRILVEYCFIRTPVKRMLFPEASIQDLKARKTYCEDIIPRPLMRYFLITIRGSIPKIDEFKADSVLFGAENKQHENRINNAKQISEEYRSKGSNSAQINWEAVYSDSRFQKTVLKLIGDIRRKIGELGTTRYLRILENYKQRDPDTKGLNTMYRPFTQSDVRQLEEALWNAEETLARII